MKRIQIRRPKAGESASTIRSSLVPLVRRPDFVALAELSLDPSLPHATSHRNMQPSSLDRKAPTSRDTGVRCPLTFESDVIAKTSHGAGDVPTARGNRILEPSDRCVRIREGGKEPGHQLRAFFGTPKSSKRAERLEPDAQSALQFAARLYRRSDPRSLVIGRLRTLRWRARRTTSQPSGQRVLRTRPLPRSRPAAQPGSPASACSNASVGDGLRAFETAGAPPKSRLRAPR